MTNKQIQDIQDMLVVAEQIQSQICNRKNILDLTPIEQARWNYWDGKVTAYKDVLRLLDAY